MGQGYLRQGETKEAIRIAEEILGLEPGFAPAAVLLGDAYYQQGESQRAEGFYLTALKLEPFNVVIQEKHKKLKEEEIDKEINSLRQKTVEEEWKVAVHLDLGKLLFTRGRLEEAVEEFQLASKDRSRASFAYNFLGKCFKENGQFHIAVEQFQKALDSLSPELGEFAKIVQLNLAGGYEALGSLMKTVSVYESVMAEDIRFASLKEKIKELKGSKLSALRSRRLIGILNNLQDKKVIALWGKIGRVGDGKKGEELSISFGQEHNNNGFELFMRGLYEGAKEEFSLAVQLDAGFATALNNLGIVYLLEGKVEDARICLEEARAKGESPSLVLNNIGLLFLLKGEYEKALQSFGEAFKLGGECAALNINMGDVCFLLGKIEEAQKFYQKVPELDVLSDFVQRRVLFRLPQGVPHETS
jgi:tetratricopeptide (TPR) repeat protein